MNNKDIDKVVAEEFYRLFPTAKLQISNTNKSRTEIGAWIRNIIEKRCTGITKKGQRCKVGFYSHLIPSLDAHIDYISNRCSFHSEDSPYTRNIKETQP